MLAGQDDIAKSMGDEDDGLEDILLVMIYGGSWFVHRLDREHKSHGLGLHHQRERPGPE